MHATNESRLSDGLRRVRARFVDELKNRHSRLTNLRADLDPDLSNDEVCKAAMTEIGQIAHKIAGTAATLGFPELGAQASAIDDVVIKRASLPEAFPDDILSQIDQMNTTIEAIIQSA